MSTIIQQLEQEQMTKVIPAFNPGDTVIVQVRVKEGDKERQQAYEGVVIAKRNRGLNSAFTVRKMSYGEGVERVFQTYSNSIVSIEVKRSGDVRRAKLYYLRGRTGKSARIKEKLRFCCHGREAGNAVLAYRFYLHLAEGLNNGTPRSSSTKQCISLRITRRYPITSACCLVYFPTAFSCPFAMGAVQCLVLRFNGYVRSGGARGCTGYC